jgi:hypothetical protein
MPLAAALAAPLHAVQHRLTEKRRARPCPALLSHKALGLAYVAWKIQGERQWRYFGPIGSAEADQRYLEFQVEWLKKGPLPIPPKGCETVPSVPQSSQVPSPKRLDRGTPLRPVEAVVPALRR